MNTKNCLLYFFEILACIMIIFIHSMFPGDFGIVVNGLARFGVPLFFIISGLYLIKDNMTKEELRIKLRKRLHRVGILLVISIVLYFALYSYLNRSAYIDWLKSIFTLKGVSLLIICNNPLINTPTWFLIAMICSYLIIYLLPNVFIKRGKIVTTIATLPILVIILRIIFIKYNVAIGSLSFSDGDLYRSWFTNGLLFISLGIIINKYKDTLTKIDIKILLPILIVIFIWMGFAHLITTKLLGRGLSYYLSNIICASLMVIISLKYPNALNDNKVLNTKGNWTVWVYIFHPAVIIILGMTCGALSQWVMPIVVVVATLVLALFTELILEVLKGSLKETKEVDA